MVQCTPENGRRTLRADPLTPNNPPPMPSSNAIAAPLSTAHFQLSTVNRPSGQDGRPERASRAEGSLCRGNSFRITYIHKMAPANPYSSHISKTKDLKPFRITYLQKKGGGRGVHLGPVRRCAGHRRLRFFGLSTFNCRL